jgi:predicted porin
MKKSLLALAVLGAFAGVASAQSSVTLFGVVDVNARYVKNDGAARRVSLSTDGINSSRFGVRGTEDLGGGLKAGFWLEGGLSADTGNAGGKFWGRRSVVQLIGGFGELRLGREYTPTFWANTIYDAFGTNGVGSSLNVQQIQLAYGPVSPTTGPVNGVNTTFVRTDNAINYYLPSNIGGIYGQFTAAAGEGNTTGTSGASKYVGGRVGFAAGPFDVSAAYGSANLFGAYAGEKQKDMNVGASYDLGVVKLMGYVARATVPTFKENRYSFSVVAPIGQGEIHAGYDRSKMTNDAGTVDNTVSQFALGYVYNLSKRTAVYSNLVRLSNGSLTNISVGSAPTGTLGGKSTGAEFGVRHIF